MKLSICLALLGLIVSSNVFAAPILGSHVSFPFHHLNGILRDHENPDRFWQATGTYFPCTDMVSGLPDFHFVYRSASPERNEASLEITFRLCPAYEDKTKFLVELRRTNPQAFIQELELQADIMQLDQALVADAGSIIKCYRQDDSSVTCQSFSHGQKAEAILTKVNQERYWFNGLDRGGFAVLGGVWHPMSRNEDGSYTQMHLSTSKRPAVLIYTLEYPNLFDIQ